MEKAQGWKGIKNQLDENQVVLGKKPRASGRHEVYSSDKVLPVSVCHAC